MRETDLAKLNSLTKYPSIPTYHELDKSNGGLREEAIPFEGEVLLSEKVDGTNSRIICLPDGVYLLGSREELLYGQGDLIGNPALGIVEALRETADALIGSQDRSSVTTFYFEVFGGKVTAHSKQYTGEGRVSFRLFDVARIPDYTELLERPASSISQWREAGGQTYLKEDELQQVAEDFHLELTPRLRNMQGADLPHTLEEANRFLEEYLPSTLCGLDAQARGEPEGIVVRTLDRKTIAKMRFQDYRRTLKRRKKN